MKNLQTASRAFERAEHHYQKMCINYEAALMSGNRQKILAAEREMNYAHRDMVNAEENLREAEIRAFYLAQDYD